MIKLSYSAAMRYLSSPLSYYLHYFMRLRTVETGSALIFGAAVDCGLNSLLMDLRDGREPSVERAKAAFDTEFMKVDPHSIKYSKADGDTSVLTREELEDFSRPPFPIEYFCLLRKGYMLIEAYAEQVLPKLEKVILVQHEICLTNELGDSLIGIVDVVAKIGGKIFILDNKTSSIKYASDAADVSEQLGTYYEALKDEYKIDGVGYIVIPKNIRKKKEPRVPIEIKLGSVSENVLNKTFEMYDTALSGIKLGKFECSGACRKQPWGCCYAKYCDSNGTDLTGLKYVDKSTVSPSKDAERSDDEEKKLDNNGKV